MYEAINKLIVDISNDPFNPALSFMTAVEYEKIGQTASAVSFYLRTAEYGYYSTPELVYAALLESSNCFERQKNRTNTVKNLIDKAIAYLPNRPEAWFVLAQYYERNKKWQESYTAAEVGLYFSTQELGPLPLTLGYIDPYVLTFQKAVAAWWVGRKDESIQLFNALLEKDLAPMYKTAVENNLSKIS